MSDLLYLLRWSGKLLRRLGLPQSRRMRVLPATDSAATPAPGLARMAAPPLRALRALSQAIQDAER